MPRFCLQHLFRVLLEYICTSYLDFLPHTYTMSGPSTPGEPNPAAALQDPHIHPSNLASFLVSCQQPGTAPYVHKAPISYPTKENKANWSAAFAGAANLEIYTRFWKAPTTAYTRIAFFSTWNSTWVGDRHWDQRFWHAWGAALVKNSVGHSMHLYIWDCDTNMDQDFRVLRPQDFIIGTQIQLIRIAKKYRRIDRIWYRGNPDQAGQDRYIEFTGWWIQQLAQQPDAPFDLNDRRFEGFQRILRA